MTEKLQITLGEHVYGTLTRGLQFSHGDWLVDVTKGNRFVGTLITKEGVDALGNWDTDDLDNIYGIGPAKAKRIYEALHTTEETMTNDQSAWPAE